MMSWNQDPEAQRWFDWPTEPLPDDQHELHCRGVIETWRAEWQAGRRAAFVVRAGGHPVGSVEVRRGGDGRGHISYLTHPDWRRRGYATRAVRLASRWAFAVGFEEVVVDVAAGNTASRRVAVAAGFTDSGERYRAETLSAFEPDKGATRTMVRYTLTRPG